MQSLAVNGYPTLCVKRESERQPRIYPKTNNCPNKVTMGMPRLPFTRCTVLVPVLVLVPVIVVVVVVMVVVVVVVVVTIVVLVILGVRT